MLASAIVVLLKLRNGEGLSVQHSKFVKSRAFIILNQVLHFSFSCEETLVKWHQENGSFASSGTFRLPMSVIERLEFQH